MFQFIKSYAETIDGVQIYPIISLSIFFVFFIALGIWTVKADKEYISIMEKIPLDKD